MSNFDAILFYLVWTYLDQAVYGVISKVLLFFLWIIIEVMGSKYFPIPTFILQLLFFFFENYVEQGKTRQIASTEISVILTKVFLFVGEPKWK